MDYSKLRHDAIFGLIIALFGMAYILLTVTQVAAPEESDTIISPRSMPYLIGGVLTLLGLTLFWDANRQIRQACTSMHAEDALPLINGLEGKRALVLGCSLVAYCFGMLFLGFLVSTAAMTLAILMLYGVRNWVAVALLTIALPLSLYGIFVYLVQVQMPDGLLI